ncbi:beta-galactosidase trimerization domain-containing protein [Coraliomargarita parva]|uniref:beta-galactosidase trimerization domain-containing protein n=1 Tax=Coraliomargarita parva TaxID=3014050 RepID=UPI0022B57E8A|nr:beta-galactosidase trimerization domain-containing protein [Coraliomargarita parva]
MKFASLELRGYGAITGEELFSEHGSVLKLASEDEAKASLLQAKYLSDLEVLPEVIRKSFRMGGSEIDASVVEGQGVVAALRSGKSVWIFASSDLDLLAANINSEIGLDIGLWQSASDAEVPMWLDRWDRFAFRHYYRPWETPKDEEINSYNFIQEFDFAEEQQRSGFVFWENMNPIDTAEGMTNSVYLDWARTAARERKLPIGLNIMTGGKGKGWLRNEYRDQTQMKMPQFISGFHKVGDPYLGGNGMPSWVGKDIQFKELCDLKHIVEDFAGDPNLTTILEPHGELRHGFQDILMEYGPLADASYQEYLTMKYGDIETLNQRWGVDFDSMDAVRVPELASFLGWGPDALDLAGIWKLKYEPLPDGETYKIVYNSSKYRRMIQTLGARDEWFAIDFDDADWGDYKAPLTDQGMFIEQRPAVVRREIDVPAEWLSGKDKVWLYVWDLSMATHDTVKIVLNGTTVAEDKLSHNDPHRCAVEVGQLLKPGKNLLAMRLPKALIAYRVYLSPDEPLQYPNLGEQGNARWVDFTDWIRWTRIEVVRDSLNMIRQVAPNQQITLMAPDAYADDMLQLAKLYGGNFHNTGYMGAFWADYLPTLMRGANRPFSLEPGGPARSLEEFKKHIGLYSTEGIQAIDYFIHIGSILWNVEIRKHFVDNLPLIKLIGKYHVPKAEIAALYSTMAGSYTGFPWAPDSGRLEAGYWQWNWRSYLRGLYESDGLSESSFESGDASQYRVIIDSNTIVMDEKLLLEIEDYVREGGIFVTFAQTGRHTPEKPDSWPIADLTGFEVLNIHTLRDDGTGASKAHDMYPASGEPVFHGDWNGTEANGLSLKQIAPDARPLMYWDDGTVAVGVRELGKGKIIQLGCKFDGRKMPDRMDPRESGLTNSATQTRRLFSQLFAWLGVAPIEYDWTPDNSNIILRHYESNNGFYDVWVAWNPLKETPLEGHIQLPAGNHADWAWDVVGQTRLPLGDKGIPIALEPLQTLAFLTPRDEIQAAPTRWFKLQRNWWLSPLKPEPVNYDAPLHPHSVDLGTDWAILPLTDGQSPEARQLTSDFDDSDWKHLDMLGVWSTQPRFAGVDHALLRKTFTVPEDWTDGVIELWFQSWIGATFATEGRIWLDGKLVSDWTENGIAGDNPFDALTPGSTYTLALEIKSESVLAGTRGTAWLWFRPTPAESINLAGTWQSTEDALHYDEPVTLPGRVDARILSRKVFVPEDLADMRVRVRWEASAKILGVLVNGHWIMRFHHPVGDAFELDVTPWVKFGAENTIELSSMTYPARGNVSSVELNFYPRD